METQPVFLDWTTSCSNVSLTQRGLQIQCNLYQNPHDGFCRNKNPSYKFLWNLMEPRIARTILKREGTKLEDSHVLISKFSTKPQSSKQYGIGLETEVEQRNRLESPETDPCVRSQIFFDKGVKTLPWGKGSLSPHAAGKTGCPHTESARGPYLIPHSRINSGESGAYEKGPKTRSNYRDMTLSEISRTRRRTQCVVTLT